MYVVNKNTGDQYTAAEFHETYDALAQVLTDMGYTPTPATADQLTKAIQDIASGGGNVFDDGGSADDYVLSRFGSRPVSRAYFEGMRVAFIAANTNTGASVVNVTALGDKDIVTETGAALGSGAITAGQIIELVYDGTDFVMIGKVAVTSGMRNILDFGADNTGANPGDNVTAFTNALAAGQEGKIYIPAGTYSFNGSVTARATNIHLYGDGFNTILQRHTTPGAGPMIEFDPTDPMDASCVVEDILFDGNDEEYGFIHFKQDTGDLNPNDNPVFLSVQHCKFINTEAEYILEEWDGPGTLHISDCMFIGGQDGHTGASGYHIGSTGFVNMIVDKCEFYWRDPHAAAAVVDVGYSAINFFGTGEGSNIKITNCYFYRMGKFYHSAFIAESAVILVGEYRVNNIIITDNVFDQCVGANGILVHSGVKDLTIENNQFKDCFQPDNTNFTGIVSAGSSTPRHGVDYDSDTAGDYFDRNDGGSWITDGFEVGMVFRVDGSDGNDEWHVVQSRTAGRLTVTGSVNQNRTNDFAMFSRAKGYCIQVKTTSAVNGGFNHSIRGNQGKFCFGGILYDGDGNGVRASEVDISNNTFKNIGTPAVQATSARNLNVTGNIGSITGTYSSDTLNVIETSAIHVSDVNESTLVSNNNIWRPARDGIYVHPPVGEEYAVTDNTIRNVGDIYSDGSYVHLEAASSGQAYVSGNDAGGIQTISRFDLGGGQYAFYHTGLNFYYNDDNEPDLDFIRPGRGKTPDGFIITIQFIDLTASDGTLVFNQTTSGSGELHLTGAAAPGGNFETSTGFLNPRGVNAQFIYLTSQDGWMQMGVISENKTA